MDDRHDEQSRTTYVPPRPDNVKPKGSSDNSVELAAGGEAERKVLESQREKMAHPSKQEPVILPLEDEEEGRENSSRGTGVGYGGAGNATYGESEAASDIDREDSHGNRS